MRGEEVNREQLMLDYPSRITQKAAVSMKEAEAGCAWLLYSYYSYNSWIIFESREGTNTAVQSLQFQTGTVGP
jgi:hypothetical protein